MQTLFETFKPIIPVFIIALMVFLFVLLFINYKCKYKLNNFDRMLKFLAYFGMTMTLIGILLVTMMPTDLNGHPLNLKPFLTIQELFDYATKEAIVNNIIMNIILFIPFGFFLYLILRKEFLVSILGMIFSILIETLQYILPIGRTTNIDDTILNIVGTILGIIIGVIFLKIEKIYYMYFR